MPSSMPPACASASCRSSCRRPDPLMDPYTQLLALLDSGTPCCAVLVVSAVGSTPREAGVRAVVEGDGRIHGTVGGGAVEARAQAAAIEACRTGRAAILDCELSGDDAADCDPICGGRMRLLVDPTAVKDRSAYEQAARALARRERGVLVTEVDAGHGVRTRVCWREGSLPPGDPAAPETFVELVAPEPLLVIAGGGHIGQALARQAILIGFQVTVIEDRPEYAAPSLFPVEATARCGDIAETLGALPSDGDTYFVIVTRGHRHDAAALRACLRKPAAYIGMIGSRR
ncbi:MAG: hypothetical protein FJX74_26430, partial [Armatimonadetes bacterium]|nr:hypothetical protein [Armatimonadota bacterium]